ncbi:6809_t:CDS:2 [Ambispora gerdemannii]|uniref:6809_t:CDS:1 n=1 Tax=Ambispora gerdemannii TaxID=144530 RepID=A0A9N9HCG8_9GLOM|nr:6809_t:CDS:2 [Ambispora gerdemannii]
MSSRKRKETNNKKLKFRKLENATVKNTTINNDSTTTTDNHIEEEKSPALKIPPEIFIKMCQNLAPSDLLSLSRVCKLYSEYLCSKESSTTQNIWRNARIEHLTSLILPPPVGFDERDYVRLVLERGCHFCNNTPRVKKVYWAFCFRACHNCLIKNIISESDLYQQSVLFREPAPLVPYIIRINNLKYERFFYIKHVNEIYLEWEGINDHDRTDWINRKKCECLEYMEKVDAHEKAEYREALFKTKEKELLKQIRAEAIEQKLDEMRNETDHEGNHYQKKYLKGCPSYNNARAQSRPLTERSWKILKGKLRREYLDVANSYRLEQELLTKALVSIN